MSTEGLSIIAAIVVGLVGAGGVATWLKVRPEASKISVDAAQGAVIVQTGVIDTLQEELARERTERRALAERLSEVERTSANVDRLNERIQTLEVENTTLRDDNQVLRARVTTLEAELATLTKQVEG